VDENTDGPWRTLLFVSTLHHLETFNAEDKVMIISSALGNALSLAVSGRLRSLSTVVLKGGWRLSLEAAYETMISTYEASEFHRPRRVLNICSVDALEYERRSAVNARFSFRGAE
jgi:hypothetical protein